MKTTTEKVTVKIGEAEFNQEFEFTALETVEDVLAQLQDAEKAKDLIANANYGSSQRQRVAIRQKIVFENGAEERATEKLIKDIMNLREKAGKPITLDKAKLLVAAMQAAAEAA